MRKLLIALTLVLLATVPVLAAETPAPAPDSAEAEPAPEEPLEIFLPERVDMACTAHQNCPGGGEVSCTGWDICQVFATSVRCDNTTVVCPSTGCSVSTTCCDGRRISCSGSETCLKVEGSHVICDGGASGGGFCPFCQDPPF